MNNLSSQQLTNQPNRQSAGYQPENYQPENSKPENSQPEAYQHFYQVLQHHARHQPDKLALGFAQQGYSYQAFYQRVRQTMEQLSVVWGLKKGARVLLAWGNHPAFCELFFAALGLGLAVMPFSSKLKEAEGESLVRQIAPQAVFYDGEVQQWLSRTANARCVSLASWCNMRLPDGSKAQAATLTPGDVAVVMFTSGTTGEPKGAMITQQNLFAAVSAYAANFALTERDSTVLAVPVYHITGLVALLALFIYLGGTLWLHQRFHALEVIHRVQKEKISFLHGSPTVFVLLCEEIRKYLQKTHYQSMDNFSALRSIACGAGHLNEGLIKELKELFPQTAIRPVYGLTETTSPATIFPGDVCGSQKTGSSGLLIDGLQIRICDDNQQVLAQGQTGHIWLKGEVVIQRYWTPAGSRAACDAQGWFYTGDVGYVDEDGYLFIKDRSKDIINRGGEKIYSLDLENIISLYAGVKEVAVIPAASALYGEEPVAFIVADENCHLASDEIINWLKNKVPRFKLPAKICFTLDLPRTHNGKINKRKLKEQFAQQRQRFAMED